MAFHETPDDYDPDAELDEIADEHGVTRDVLGEYEDRYADKNPFRTWWHKDIATKDLSENTVEKYELHIEHWIDFMDEQGRHPALPAPWHVRRYIEYLRDERENAPKSIKGKLYPVQRAFGFFARKPAFGAHKPDTNIIKSVKQEIDLSPNEKKEFPNLSLGEVREMVENVKNIRDRAVIALQIKLGIRAGTTSNIKLQDIHLGNQLHDHFDELGQQSALVENDREKAIHIPADREGTKSKNDRTLPLDKETRTLLTQYLLIRPDNGEEHLFLSTDDHVPMGYRAIGEIWQKQVKPQFPETEQYKAVTSHFGRHFFSDYWGVEKDVNLHLLQYMRGDTVKTDDDPGKNGVDHYLHPEYEDVEEMYRQEIYRLNL